PRCRRYLRARRWEPAGGHTERRSPQSSDRTGAERRAHARAEQRAHTRQPAIAEGADAYPVDRIAPLQDRNQRGHGTVVLRIDVDSKLGPRAEQVLQQWDGFPSVDLG